MVKPNVVLGVVLKIIIKSKRNADYQRQLNMNAYEKQIIIKKIVRLGAMNEDAYA